jgi:hypothetical protein
MHKKSSEKGRREEREREGMEGREGEGERREGGGAGEERRGRIQRQKQTLIKPPNLCFFFLILSSLPDLPSGQLKPCPFSDSTNPFEGGGFPFNFVIELNLQFFFFFFWYLSIFRQRRWEFFYKILLFSHHLARFEIFFYFIERE